MTDLISTPCSEWAELLITQHPDDSSSADTVALKKHLLVCTACYTAYIAYQEVSEQLRSLPPMIPQRQLSADMLLNNTNLLSEEPSLSGPESESMSRADHVQIPAVNADWHERPCISIAIPTHNEAPNLRDVLLYIPATASEVILIDGHSAENTIAEAQRLLPSLKTVRRTSNRVYHQTTGHTAHSPHLKRNVNNAQNFKLPKNHYFSHFTASISSAAVMGALVVTALLFWYPFLLAGSNSSMRVTSSKARTDVLLAVNPYTQPLRLLAAQLCNIQGADLGQVQPGQNKSGVITLGNCGSQPLTWQAQSDGSSWLTLSKSSGTLAPNGTGQIAFTATTSPFDQGRLSTLVTIVPAVGQPQQTTVVMTVVPPPQPQLCYVQDVDLGQIQQGRSKSGVMTIANCGSQPLTWQAQENDLAWLKLNKSSGTLVPNATDQVSLTVTTNATDQGPRYATVAITSNGGYQQVIVKLIVSPSCSISVDPTTLSFTTRQGGKDPASQSFTVTSNCTGTITTSVSTNNGESWLSAGGGGHINASDELAINVFVQTQSLSTGSYTGVVKVTFTDANGVSATQQISGEPRYYLATIHPR